MNKFDWESVGGIPFHIFKCGHAGSFGREVFFIIPGNPGNMGFYVNFSEALNEATDIPVWGVSHTGHAKTINDCKSGIFKSVDCSLSSQIEHKLMFLKCMVLPYFDKVYLIGHSIGCYILLHVLDRLNDPKLYKGIMLFPGIERLAISPQGKQLAPLLIHGHILVTMFTWLLKFVPYILKNKLVSFLFKNIEETSRHTILHHVLEPNVANACMLLGMQEMQQVDQRNDDIIRSHLDKLVFYYGRIDHWCPVPYYEEIKLTFEDINAKLCDKNYRHAFVLQNSKNMAIVVRDMLKNDFRFV